MEKRQFLSAALAGSAALATSASVAAGPDRARGPTLLTITGALGRTNRPAFDPVLDQMMGKQHISFDKAYALDHAALAALPQHKIRPTLEYDGRPRTLAGPLLSEVVALARPLGEKLSLRAVDGYAVTVTLAQVKAWRMLVATHLDGAPMPLGGLGPCWAVLDADRIPELAARPLKERFAACPWALYQIGVAV
jgi:hypothetical protein